ncbi:hypothetical protein PCANB_002419 [Pneumocystis canis]|nr:hypothetical protein PCANB_002419 [Pneumocystis canis]
MRFDLTNKGQEEICGSIETQDLSFSCVNEAPIVGWMPSSLSSVFSTHVETLVFSDNNNEKNDDKTRTQDNYKCLCRDVNVLENKNESNGVKDFDNHIDLDKVHDQTHTSSSFVSTQSKKVMLKFHRMLMPFEKESDVQKTKKQDKTQVNGKTNDKVYVLSKTPGMNRNECHCSIKVNSDQISRNVSNRFVLFTDGTHFHTLRKARREEKLRSLLRDFLGVGFKKEGHACVMNDVVSTNNLSLINNCMDKMKLEKLNSPKKEKVFINGNASLVERYGKCHEVIGKGAYGVVRVSHKTDPGNARSEQFYAVKEFRRRPAESRKRYTKRLTSEFCISSALRHPNVIHTLDLVQDSKGGYCEVMEFCAGGDLYSLILASGKLDMVEADCYFKQLMRGVEYMHEMGVAHRDLKPENLLLTHNGALKITDFGNGECFRMAWEKKAHLTCGLCGSVPYIAPEEYIDKEFDPRAVDVWATGVIYMAMRTGRHLWRVAKQDEDDFYNKYLQERKNKAGYEPIESLQGSCCRNVIYSILDPLPERRISAKHVLLSQWGREILVCKAGEIGNELVSLSFLKKLIVFNYFLRTGFKKAVNRAGTHVMIKAGQVEKTIDRDFDTEERRFRTLEQAVLRLQREAKNYLDSLRLMSASQVRIAQAMDEFYPDTHHKDRASKHYMHAVEDLDVRTMKELDEIYRMTVLDPISKFCTYFPEINAAITKRNHKLIDYDAMRAKVKRLTDKPSDDIKKLPMVEKEASMAKDTYITLNTQLLDELPQFIDLRVPYLDASFEALVKIQFQFCYDGYDRMSKVQQYFSSQVRNQYSNGELDQKIDDVLQRVRNLSISGLILTFYKGEYTKSERLTPSPQIVCVGGDAKGLYEPSVIQCKNMGSEYDPEDIQWSCSSLLPSFYKLGRTDVVCEGYSGPYDKYVLKGSCFLEYTLHLTEKGKLYHKKSNFSFFIREDNMTAWSIAIYRAGRTLLQNWNPGNWFGGDGGNRPGGPPPPYSGSPYGKTYASRSIWTPGFWSGLLGGAALSYIMRRSRERDIHPNGLFYRREFWGDEYRDDYRNMASNTSSYTMRTSTGFGTTRRM